jgi:hypothetical protein
MHNHQRDHEDKPPSRAIDAPRPSTVVVRQMPRRSHHMNQRPTTTACGSGGTKSWGRGHKEQPAPHRDAKSRWKARAKWRKTPKPAFNMYVSRPTNLLGGRTKWDAARYAETERRWSVTEPLRCCAPPGTSYGTRWQPLPPMNPLSSHNPNTAFQGSEEDGEQSREKEGMHVPRGESYMPRTKYCVR